MVPVDESLLKTVEVLEECGTSEQTSKEKCECAGADDSSCSDVKENYLAPFNLTENVEYKHLYGKQKDSISGVIVGGCLDVMIQFPGTKLDNTVNFCNQFKEEGMLWYLENCELTVPAVYRALLNLKNSGWFHNANGFLIGRTYSKEAVEDFTYEDALHKVFDDMNVPVIYDVDIGHVPPQWTMINGAFGKFEYENKKGKIEQEMCVQ
jgi:muramoyltetrapeptide carboxypeptidase LdcA involved in peptidoglycan recycling